MSAIDGGYATTIRALKSGTLSPDDTARASALFLVAILAELQILRRELNTITQTAGSAR